MILESTCYPISSFATLTYAPQHLPAGGSLSKGDLRRFLRVLHERGTRYFLVGEYGDRSWRPHYHAILFGLDPLEAERVCCAAWTLGFTQCGPASLAAIGYVAGYVAKKMTRVEDSRLGGRSPEFTRMSRNPALGWPGLSFARAYFVTDAGQAAIQRMGGIPREIKCSGKTFPLGRTMREKLREALDLPPPVYVPGVPAVWDLDPVLKAERERKRYGNYETLRARSRAKGAL